MDSDSTSSEGVPLDRFDDDRVDEDAVAPFPSMSESDEMVSDTGLANDERKPRQLFFVRIDPRRGDSSSKSPVAPAMRTTRTRIAIDEKVASDRTSERESQLPIVASPPTTNEPSFVELGPSCVESHVVTAPAIEARPPAEPVRRADPLRHGVIVIVTVGLMLAAARFALPGIVEEIRYAQRRGQLRAEFEVAGNGLKDVSLDTLSQAYEMVSAAAGPSVVHIDIQRADDRLSAHAAVGFDEERASIPGVPSTFVSDQGSGVVVDKEGYILTNRHVVENSQSIWVTLSDGRQVSGEIVGTDEKTDLAVLKVEADGLLPIPWGDSDNAKVGSPVWAIGSPFGLDRTVTFGILSGKHRVVRAKDQLQDFMQSDVAVNPGNSGGPLVDSRGTLIGINTAIVGDTYQGVSFAIPSSVAQKVYRELKRTGSMERGWLGVTLNEVPDSLLRGDDRRMRGALIRSLASTETGAARAGLMPGDVILSIDQEPIRDVPHLIQVVGNSIAGSRLTLRIVRDGIESDIVVTLSRRPANL